MANGKPTEVEDIMRRIEANPFADVTFSGGDPMLQPEAFAELARMIKERTKKTIWCYTGYRYEYLISKPKCLELLKYVDVLVDGKFVFSLKDETLLFRGSSNQRLIDVSKSEQAGEVVLLPEPGGIDDLSV
jgi:anaerobic ribonucleoside-triphosphate reductase activating protein